MAHALRPYDRNARTHTEKQVNQITASIQQFGFNNPILVDSHKTIIAGHGRWMAAQKLKLAQVPTICLDHLNDQEVRAYILADNKLAELAGCRLLYVHRLFRSEKILPTFGFDLIGRRIRRNKKLELDFLPKGSVYGP